MGGKQSLKLVAQPQEYFRELVTDALGRQKVATKPETEFYLVNLLYKYMITDRLKDEALAILLKEALEQPSPLARNTMLKEIGDISLYKAGFFQDSFNRKLVDVDYYIDMGGHAYQQVAYRSDEEILKILYQELSEKFGAFVEVLAQVSDMTSQKTEKDILRLYEIWVRTRSERAAKALQEAGIVPNPLLKKEFWQ
jgi:hypothetical protein